MIKPVSMLSKFIWHIIPTAKCPSLIYFNCFLRGVVGEGCAHWKNGAQLGNRVRVTTGKSILTTA